MGSEAAHLEDERGHAAGGPAGDLTSQKARAALVASAAVSSALVDVSALARSRQLPVAAGLASLFGDSAAGLPRGGTVAVTGRRAGSRPVPGSPVPGSPVHGSPVPVPGAPVQGAVALTLALAAEAMKQGSWMAVVDSPWLGLAALPGFGIPPAQVVMVDRAGSQWGSVMAALVDGFDLVVYANRSVGERDRRRIQAHAREKGAVLVQLGGHADSARGGSADLQFVVEESIWSGLGQGSGALSCRQVVVSGAGRRRRGRPVRAALWLPDADGQVRSVEASELPGERQWAGSDIDHIISQEPGASQETPASQEEEPEGRRLRRVQ